MVTFPIKKKTAEDVKKYLTGTDTVPTNGQIKTGPCVIPAAAGSADSPEVKGQKHIINTAVGQSHCPPGKGNGKLSALIFSYEQRKGRFGIYIYIYKNLYFLFLKVVLHYINFSCYLNPCMVSLMGTSDHLVLLPVLAQFSEH